MSLVGNLLGQGIAFIFTLIAYFTLFQSFKDKLENKINKSEQKLSKILDQQFLNSKMKTKEFLEYHKKIHMIENERQTSLDKVINLKWSLIGLIALIFFDGVFEKITVIYPNLNNNGFQGFIEYLLVIIMACIVVFGIATYRVNKNLSEDNLKNKTYFSNLDVNKNE